MYVCLYVFSGEGTTRPSKKYFNMNSFTVLVQLN